jgi:ribonuclease HI
VVRPFPQRHVVQFGMVTSAKSPHFLLYSEASGASCGAPRWKFVLQAVDSDDQFAAGDVEPGTPLGRLELLAVVRGLEAIDQPSRVTLVTRSRYVARGIRREIGHWRDRAWHWERFGKLVPIRDRDLWQRVDRALTFHEVNCIRQPAYCHSSSLTAAGICSSPPSQCEPALLIVPRLSARAAGGHRGATTLARAFNRLCDGIFAPFSAILRPAFTRAA